MQVVVLFRARNALRVGRKLSGDHSSTDVVSVSTCAAQ